MLHHTLKNIAILFFIGLNDDCLAHTLNGTLGVSQEATDLYQVNCFDDGTGLPAKLATRILDKAPIAAPVVSVQTFKGKLATNSSDQKDGDAVFSPEVKINGGFGIYYVLVDKSAAGAEIYTLSYHCLTAQNKETGASLIPLQNQ